MRHIGYLIVALAALTMLLAGCKDGTGPDPVVSEADIAQVVASSLGGAQSTAGLSAQVQAASVYANGGSFPKIGVFEIPVQTVVDTPLTFNFHVQKDTGLYRYNYAVRYTIAKPVPDSAYFQYEMRGTYDTPRMASDDSAYAKFSIFKMAPASKFDVVYHRIGSQVFKTKNQLQFKSDISSTMTLYVDNLTGLISSGTGAFRVQAESSNGASVIWEATIVFNGGQLAVVTVNGKSFSVNLNRGEVEGS